MTNNLTPECGCIQPDRKPGQVQMPGTVHDPNCPVVAWAHQPIADPTPKGGFLATPSMSDIETLRSEVAALRAEVAALRGESQRWVEVHDDEQPF